jgi:endonuclease YncB( thermonuclease family)
MNTPNMRARVLNLSFLLLVMLTAIAGVVLIENLRGLSAAGGTPIPGAIGTAVRRQPATVARVLDGRTIELENGTTVRLIGLELPSEPEFIARAAQGALQAMVSGQSVLLESDAGPPDGRHLFLPTGTYIQAELLRSGYATLDPDEPNRYLKWLQDEQEQAQRARLGLWQYAPRPTPVILSTYTLPTLRARNSNETAVPFVCGPATTDDPRAIDLAAVEKHGPGSTTTVVFNVAATTMHDDDTILYSKAPAESRFNVIIPAQFRDEFLGPPDRLFQQRCIKVTGQMQLAENVRQITLRQLEDIRIVR